MWNNMCEQNVRNYIDLSRATNIAMGSGAFAFISIKIGSFNIVRKSLDGVGGNFFEQGDWRFID